MPHPVSQLEAWCCSALVPVQLLCNVGTFIPLGSGCLNLIILHKTLIGKPPASSLPLSSSHVQSIAATPSDLFKGTWHMSEAAVLKLVKQHIILGKNTTQKTIRSEKRCIKK